MADDSETQPKRVMCIGSQVFVPRENEGVDHGLDTTLDRTEDSVRDAEDLDGVQSDFRAVEPWFQKEENPWAQPLFAQQADFLQLKRQRCLDDLTALKALLAKVGTLPFEERKPSFNSILNQVAGAYTQLARIDGLLTAVKPGYSPEKVFHRVMHREFQRNALASPVPRYYTLEVSHAA